MSLTNIEKFIEAFRKVKAMGEIKSNRSGNTGIGKTLEDIMNVKENNLQTPDLYNFEIKSQRGLSESYVTLFTKSPKPRGVNTQLRLKYGTFDEEFKDLKVLHTSIFYNRWNTHKSGYSFMVDIEEQSEKIFLRIKSLDTNIEENVSVNWDFKTLKTKLEKKLQNLAFVNASSRKIDGIEYFNFKECMLYSGGLTLERFIKALKDGLIMYDIRIGVYHNPLKRNYGKSHDHGSAFRIKKENFLNLYDKELIIN